MNDRHVSGREAAVVVAHPPGGYGDGPVFIRVDKDLAGPAWPQPGQRVEINDGRCCLDPKHDYVIAENTHNAFIYARWIRERGVPAEALAVVSLT